MLWVVVVGMWGVLNWLTYIQMKAVISLRPITKYVFWTQVVVSALFLLAAVFMIISMESQAVITSTPSYGIY